MSVLAEAQQKISNGSWGTPIYSQMVQDASSLNEQLLEDIRERAASERSMSMGMVNARKSAFTLLKSQSDATQRLHGLIFEASQAMNRHCLGRLGDELDDLMVSEAWAVLYDTDGYHKLHSHFGSAWSGVYYVLTGDLEPGAGAIEFVDPRAGALANPSFFEDPTLVLDPAPGMLIVFPSWLQHCVTPVQGSTERVCVAFNVGFDRTELE